MATLSEMIRELQSANQAGRQVTAAQPQPVRPASTPASTSVSTQSPGQTLSNAIKQLSNAQDEVNALKEAYQGKAPSTNQGIKPTTVDDQTTRKATREETAAAGVTKNTNPSLESFYTRRDEAAGQTSQPKPTASVSAAQSALNSKNADSTVKNTLLSYYSKREFEGPITAQPLSNVTPSRADNTIMGTAQTYAGAMGAGLANLGKKLTDVVYDNNNNVTGPGLTEYARNYYSDKSDDFLRANLSDAEYRAVTNALRTNADMRKQATAQRDAMDALQMKGREKLEQAENGLGKIGTTAVHVGSNVMEMTADRAITAALSFLGIPQKAAQYTPLYLRSMGASNLEARQSGATENQAFVYGNLAGALEVATETMLSPTNFAEAAYGKGWLGSGVGKEAIGTLSRRLAKSELGRSLIYMAGTLGAAGAEESLEEGVSGIFTPLIKRMTYDKDAKFDMQDTADSMLTAFLATILTGGAGVAQTSRAAKVYNNPTTVNSLINVAKETQDEKSKAYKFADSLAKAVEGGTRPTSLEVADLVRYLNESGSKEQTNKLYQLADVDKTDSNAKAQLNAAVTYAMQEANELISDPANATQAATRNFDNNINILVNALVSEDVADVLKPSIAYTLQSANTTRQASTEGTPIGIRRGDTVSYHTSQMANETAPEGIAGYDVVRRHDDGSVDYIWTDDFNGNAFPTITKQTTVSANGKVTDTTPKNATIINDKSTLVAPNYTGFDVNQQRNNENYWKEGRKRTGLAYNITQMNNKTYFDNYMNMLRQADARAQQAQQEEVIDNGGSESVPGDTGRTGTVAAEEQGGGVREATWYDKTRARIDEFRHRYADDHFVGKRATEIEKLASALESQNAKETDAKKFAGEVGGVAGTTVIPVTGKAAKQYASLTKALKKLGARNVKYFVGALYVYDENGTDTFPVNGAYTSNGTLYVRLDSMYQTPEQLGRHEVFHLLCDKYDGLENAAYDFLFNKFGSKAVGTMERQYIGAYNGLVGRDQLIQEMLCDAFGNTHVLASQYGTNPFNEELVKFVNEYTNGESDISTEEVDTSTETVDTSTEEAQPTQEEAAPEAEEITEPNVETVEPETENAEESTEANVNTAPESAAVSEESTEENVNTEQQIQVQRTRNGEWENVNRDQAIKYAKGLYKRLRNAYRDPSARLNAVNNTIRGYQVTAEDLGVQEEIATAQAENTETTAPAETQRNEVLAENREIWNEPNAKKKYKGRAKSPDNYQWEVVEAYPNGNVDHVFFDTEAAADGYARLRNSAHGDVASATKVDLTRAGALEHALSEVLREIEDIMDEDADYRVSVADQAALAEVGVGIDEETNVAYSLATWEESEYVKDPNAQAKILARNIGITQKQALAYIQSINSVAAKIASDKTRWDYESAPGMSSYMNNAEYVKTIDFSTICKKRRLFSGTFSAIQKALPNTVFTADDLLEIRKSMQEDAGLEVPCHMCFVEGSRIKMGEYAAEFIKQFKAANPDAKWIPNMYDVNTPEGAEAMRLNHPDVYEQYNYYWNTQGRLEGFDHWKKYGRRPKSLSTPGTFSAQGKPKLFQAATAYDGEIVKYYGKDYDADVKTIREAKKNGTMDSAEAKAAKERVDRVDKINLFAGIRMQSFSDFEIIHLIDAMQVVMDLSVAGLKSHAYTKVGDFARALGQTGVKINLSLVAKGVDENGKLIFNEVEGMKWSEVEELRKQFPNTVGDIVVTFNDKQLMAAMDDDRIDFIIPFHRSQWTKKQFNKMGLGTDSKDYAPYQKERWLNSKEHTHIGKKGEPVLTKIVQIPPMAYWDYNKTGEQNAKEYLRLCHEGGTLNGYEIEKGRRPKFYKLLVRKSDGSFELPSDDSKRSQAIRKGYWKLLIDFKMYDNDGKAAPFENVKPIFDVDTATQMLDSYEGGHRELPVAEDFANNYIEKFKKDHPNVKYSRALTTEADREYAKAVENGYIQDMYDAIDKAAKDAGYIYDGYHGTPDGGFTVFRDDDAIFLTDLRKMADTYRNADMNGDFPSDSQTYKLYAKMENPLVINGYKQDIYGVSWSDVHYSDPIIEQAEDLNTILEDTYMSYASDPLGEIKGSSAIEWGDYKDLREFIGEDRFDSAREKIDELLKEWSFENDDRGDIGSEAWQVFEDEIFHPVRTRNAENGLNVSGTRDIVKVAEREGYDGIIIKGITDYGGVPSDGDYEPATVYVVFNASQVKSGELITYDDNGDIIPPSQRFNENIDDIRYSRALDSDDRELTPDQAEFFADSKIRDDEGRLLTLYHGTTNYGEITKFKKGKYGWLGGGIYLTSRKADAQRYANAMGEGNGTLYELYANITNPLVVTEQNPVPSILRAAYGNDRIYEKRKANQSNDPSIITPIDIKKLQAKGYDGIRWDYGNSTEVSAFYPEQVKRVDNSSPTNSKDIRYSRALETEEDKAYDAALKAGDMGKAREEILKQAEKKGFLIAEEGYHGSRKWGFTEFDLRRMDDKRSIFVTTNPNVAKTYSGSDEYRTPVVLDKFDGTTAEDVNNFSVKELVDFVLKYNILGEKTKNWEGLKVLNANEYKDHLKENIDFYGKQFENYDSWVKEINGQWYKSLSKEHLAVYEEIANSISNLMNEAKAGDINGSHRLSLAQAINELEDLPFMDGDMWVRRNDYRDSADMFLSTINELRRIDRRVNQNEYVIGDPHGIAFDDGFMNAMRSIATKEIQKNMGPSKPGNYRLFIKPGNSYELDANGANWNALRFDPDNITERVAKLAKKIPDMIGLGRTVIDSELEKRLAVGDYVKYGDINNFFANAVAGHDDILNELARLNSAYARLKDDYGIDAFSNGARTRQVSAWAYKNGYDSVHFKNITDDGPFSTGKFEKSDIYILFNPWDVKSADTMTYDNKGDVIPPSQRFDETSNDIRYSRMVEDEEYSAMVESNPTEARKILQAKAEENGYTYHGYHGTPLGGFSKFNRNQIWLTPHKAMADTYHKNSPEGYTYDLYARMNNPLVVDAKEHAWKSLYYTDKTIDEYERLLDQVKSGGTVDWTDTENLQKALGSFEKLKARIEKHLAAGNNTIARQTVSKDMYDALKREYQYHWGIDLDGRYTSNEIVDFAQKQGYDGVIFNNMYDYTHSADLAEEDEIPATVYVVFGKQNVKSANLMTYGYDGWEIPLSERFNDRQQDIRFSRAFDEVSAARAIAETNYAKTIVNNFNGLEQAKKASVKAAPSKVAKALATKYNSSVKTEDVKKAVGQMNKYIAEKIAAGSEVSYDTLRDMADPIARHAVMNNKSLTDTDGYKTYSKLVDVIDKTTIAVSGNISRNIDNYKGWLTANLDNINVDKTGKPVKAVYDDLNKMFGDNLFPTNLKQYEMLQRIAEVVGNYRTIYENPYNFNVDIASIYATNDIINEVLQTPGNIALGEINLEEVLKNVNDSRNEMLAEMGEAYEKGEPINVTKTEAYRQARTSATEDSNAKQITLAEREWRTTPTSGAEGREVLSPTDVIAKMEQTLGFNITEGHIKKRGVLGVFYRRNRGIRIMLDNDLPTTSHELGHALDLKYKVEAGLSDAMKDELLTKHDAATRDLINDPRYSDSERIGEAIAEYNRVFLTNKDDAFNRFPLFSKYYLNKMDEDDRANLIALADNINAYYVKAAKTAQASIRLMSQGKPDFRTWQEKLEDICTHLYQVWVDSNYAIKKYISDPTGSDAYVRATNAAYADARAGQIITGQLFSKDGTFVSGGLTAALEEINLNDDAEYLAFGEYLVVKHGPEFKESTGGHVFANPIEDNPNWMRNRAKELEEKYPQFKESAEKLYKFQNDFLMEYAVKTGILSKDTYDDWTQNYVVKAADKSGKPKKIPVRIVETDDGKGTILVDENGNVVKVGEDDHFHKARWQYYVPFNRVIARTGKGQLVANKSGYANQTGVFHGAHGSTKDLYHPVDNIMRNIIKITKAGINNDVGLAIADAALKHNIDAQYLEKITPTMRQQMFYTEQLKKSLLRQLEEADAYGKTEIDEDSYDVFENIIAQMDAVVAQYTPGNPVGDHIVVMRNGKEEWWHINDHMLLESMTRLNPKRIDGFFGTLAVMSRFMTSNITGNNLIWSLSRNAPKDLGTLLQYSPTKSPIKIFGGIAQAYGNSLRDTLGAEVDPFYLEYLAMGGGKTSAYTSDINTADRSRKQMRIKAVTQKTHKLQLKAFIKGPIEAVEVFSDTVELGPRYATYRAMRMDGKDPHEAFYDACDVTVNFRRGGYLARQVNMVTPFFNANVQGIDKFFRYFTASDVKAGDKAKALAGRAAFFVTHSAILAGITMALNYRDKKKKKEYEQLSAFTKNNYWCIPADIANRFGGFFGKKLKSGEFIALPKPRELGILSSFMERCLEATMWKNENAFNEFSTYLTGNLLPAYLQELADGIIDKNSTGIGKLLTEGGTNLGIIGVGVYLYANKDFLGRPIVSEALLDYEKKDQYTGKTSLPAYYIAQAFAKYGQELSPQQIDFIGNQVFSNVWKPMQAWFPKDKYYRDLSAGVKNAWVKDNQFSNDLVNWLYEHTEESLRAHNSDKENFDKTYRYKMDNDMKTFYGRYNGLTKEMDETADSREYRQKVLDMVSDYQESIDLGVPASQRAVYEVVRKAKDTDLLPSVLKTTVKDGNGKEYELNYKQYYDYQGSFKTYYYDIANSGLGVLTTQHDKEILLGEAKTLATNMAKEQVLARMGKPTTGSLDKYADVDLTQVAIFTTLKKKADAENTAVDEKTGKPKANNSYDQGEIMQALNSMTWLTPHEKAVLWQSTQNSSKNNPWLKYL